MSNDPLHLKQQLARYQNAVSAFMSSWGDRKAIERLGALLEKANASPQFVPIDGPPTHEVNEGRVRALEAELEQARSNAELYKAASERFQRANTVAVKRLAVYARLGEAVDAILNKWREAQPHIGDVDDGRFVELSAARTASLSDGPPPPAGPIQRMVATWEERNAQTKIERDAVDALIAYLERRLAHAGDLPPFVTAIRESRK